MLGESQEAQKERIERATRGAKDVSSLVKKKKINPTNNNAPMEPTASSIKTNGKRNADEFEEEGCSRQDSKRQYNT